MRIHLVGLAAVAAASLASGTAHAQYEYPPPAYAPPPPAPPVYYAPPPPRRLVLPPPWIKPPRFVRGYLGISGFGAIDVHQNGGVEYLHSGGGFGIFGGVDIGRFFALDFGYDASFHNPVTTCEQGFYYSWCGANYLVLESLHVDAKIHIPTRTRVMPFVQAGGVASWIGRAGSLTDSSGGGFEAGGGLDLWLSRYTTLGFSVMYRGLAMSDYATYSGTNTYFSFVNVGGNLTTHF